MKENLVKKFIGEQTLINLQELKNNGIELYRISYGKWERIDLMQFTNRFVRLYDDNFELIGLGAY